MYEREINNQSINQKYGRKTLMGKRLKIDPTLTFLKLKAKKHLLIDLILSPSTKGQKKTALIIV